MNTLSKGLMGSGFLLLSRRHLLPSLLALTAFLTVSSGCYLMRPNKGGGQAKASPPRVINATDVALPTGYRIEAMAEGLTFPTGVAFDSQGAVYVVESGYSYGEKWTTPRLLRIGANGQLVEVASGGRNGPWTGAAFFEGAFYIAEGGAMEGGRILRVTPGGQTQAIVDGLPSFGDHHTDGPVVGPDGWIYFGQGTASNSGVVGPDNLKFGWLKRAPSFHDIPGEDVTLVGQNFASVQRGKITGAFVPDGEATSHGQVVKGQVKCSGGILRVRPDGSNLELVAWGFRNPFGLAFSPEGALYATDNGYDERGSRPVWGSPDFLWKVERGLWHGWPDFVGGLPITEEQFKPPTKPNPKFLLAKHPNKPPQPAARLPVHSSANGLDFSRSPDFGHVGQAFVALFGDQTPVVGKSLHPAGFKVVRVDPQTGVIEDFAVNKGRKNGPASKVGGGGLERPVAARFSPDGKALYIVDFGMMPHDKAGAKPKEGTGVIWKVTREGGEK